jgi:two-component system, NarL family, invasion response regulator UvrY
MIRILIADDYAVVRRGLKLIVAEEADMTVVGEAATAEEMLAFVRTQPCDLVVTDISMPGRSGLDVLGEIRQEYPHLPVLVLSMHSEDQYGMRALQLGASGYLTKDNAPKEMVKAIRKVVTGGKFFSSTIIERAASNLSIETEQPVHEMLSKREHEVLCLIATGKTRTEIAGNLALSAKTVSTYRMRILEKMAMKKTADLVRYAITNRLVN